MSEYISRVFAIKAMDELEQEDIEAYGCKIPEGFDGERARLALSLIPSADVRPNIHGHWIEHKEHCENLGVMPSGLGAYKWCSNCDCGIDVKEWHRNNYTFCPNCGADMRGKT